jgi:hypothetical protein
MRTASGPESFEIELLMRDHPIAFSTNPKAVQRHHAQLPDFPCVQAAFVHRGQSGFVQDQRS